MAPRKPTQAMVDRLTETDRSFLTTLYRQRCLDTNQAFRFFYDGDGLNLQETEDRLRGLADSFQLLKKTMYRAPGSRQSDAWAWFLTGRGVETVIQLNGIPKTAPRKRDGKMVRIAKTASDLAMKPFLIPHQLGLNSFVLRLKARVRDSVRYRYYDQIYMPWTSRALMPDGLIQYGDMWILLEQDMGTENGKQLKRKFDEGYRTFLTHLPPLFWGKKIVVLFLLDNLSSARAVERRKDTVRFYLYYYLFDLFAMDFEAFLDSPDVLLDILTCQIFRPKANEAWEADRIRAAARDLLTRNYGFTCMSSPKIRRQVVSGFDGYIGILDSSGHAVRSCGRRQEFFLDFWLEGRVSVLYKIAHYNPIAQDLYFWKECRRHIPYLVVLPDLNPIADIKRVCRISDQDSKSVFFVTLSRLEEGKPFCETIFQVDELGNVCHFTDDSLREKVYEKRIRLKKGHSNRHRL